MLFNSIDFAVFLPIVFILYWFVANKDLKWQNLLVVAASYLFYGWWDWRFLLLLFSSTAIDFLVGLKLGNEKNQAKRKMLLWTSITVNLGALFFFKYYGFFIESFAAAFTFFGTSVKSNALSIILPVGISFYTFQTLSYAIDVYRGKLPPTKDFVVFMAYVSFFPQLVAGPIERATHLLPQFQRTRTFVYSKAADGLRQILWGLFKKVVIADSCAMYVNTIFNDPTEYNGSTLLIGVMFFSFQIYGDFSGYSDIAIGTARLFGFDLMKNFAFPYFSRDVAEFWRRWHISLSTWFRDYLYIPLGGSQGSTLMKVRNTFIVFIVSAFWHGANWTFIAWGVLHAIYFLPLLLTNRNRLNLGVVPTSKFYPTLKEFLSMASTFALISLAWVFFRAENIGSAVYYLKRMFSSSLFEAPNIIENGNIFITGIMIILFFYIEWKGKEGDFAIQELGNHWKKPYRHIFYYAIVFALFCFGGKEQQFIYFQF